MRLLRSRTVELSTVKTIELLLKTLILFTIAGAAISSRLFSVIRFESIIHEFDPWFNFRATKYLVNHGFYNFLNWFDDRTWYPLGRVTGGTLYPGLMVTSTVVRQFFVSAMNLPIDIRNICVLLAPAFSALTAVVTYLFGKEMKDSTTGLLAAFFIAIAPGYISRSVAGSYDNEAIAITLLMSTFYFWVKAHKLGSAFWASLCALSYFYMVSAWGGYVFITNMIPLHVFVLLLMGRYSPKIYVSYSTWYVLGTIASMQIPFVGVLPIRSSEHMAALGIFGLVQLVAAADYVRTCVSPQVFKRVIVASSLALVSVAFVGLIALTYAGVIAPWTGRFYSLWDTEYARIHIPIIASVSEHQPTAWPSFFFDTSMLIWLFPAGVYFSLQELRDEHVFLIVYSVLASYFAGVMVRLMLTLTPIVCVAAAIAISCLWDVYQIVDSKSVATLEVTETSSTTSTTSTTSTSSTTTTTSTTSGVAASNESFTRGNDSTNKFFAALNTYKPEITLVPRLTIILSFIGYLILFVYHCTWVTSNAYSSPSVVLASQMPDGSQFLIDDFREAYYWLRMNTAEDANIMSWWDYGYQIGGLADRTTLVDNNTWNNTHIATVGKAMSSSEEKAYPILKQHDVDYILVIFGGVLGYSGDDINKFLWMIRISGGIWPDEIKESDFFTPQGEYRVDSQASETMKNSLMYKMSYYRFSDLFQGRPAHDRVRDQIIQPVNPLTTIEEAFTSENWIVRIYKVKDLDLEGRDFKSAAAFSKSQKKKKSPQQEARV